MGYGLNAYDAVHVATCDFTDVPCLATIDLHFEAVKKSSLKVWVREGRVADCRRLR
jgi:hypothetical protein